MWTMQEELGACKWALHLAYTQSQRAASVCTQATAGTVQVRRTASLPIMLWDLWIIKAGPCGLYASCKDTTTSFAWLL